MAGYTVMKDSRAVAANIDSKLYADIEKYSVKNRIKMSDIFREALREWMERKSAKITS